MEYLGMARVLRPRTAPRGHRGWRGSVSRPGGFPVGHHRRRLRVRIPAGDAPSIPDEGRDALLRRAILAVDMAHIMGGPEEILQRFGRAVESVLREGRATIDADQPPADVGLLIPELLPSAKAPKLDPEHLLERAEGLTRKEFKRRYFNEDKPVALGNVGASWPALRKWRDLRWLKREHGHRNIPLEIGAYDDAANWREEVMPIARFVDEYLAPGLERELAESEAEAKAGAEAEVAGDAVATPAKNVAYLAQHQLFEQLPSLLSDFDPPDVCCTTGGVQRVNAWVGTAGTVTPCHFDSYDNLLGQVAGFKFVRLYAESDSPFLYRSAGALAENRSWPGGEGEGGGGEHVEEESRGAGRARAGAGIGRGGETHRGTSVRWTWSIRTWRSFRSSRRRGTWT